MESRLWVVLTAACLAVQGKAKPSAIGKPEIRTLHVNTEIRHRYAVSKVTSQVANPSTNAQEIQFKVTLPDEAFISNFSMLIQGKEYVAYVKEKEAAKAKYDQAVARGQSAGHVALNPRDSNRFTVAVNVAAEEKVVFTLTYEELLHRRLGDYEYVINIDPGQIVKDLKIRVVIQEQPYIKEIRVPDIRNSVELVEDEKANPLAKIERPTTNSAIVTYAPTLDEQLKFSDIGIQGQFSLQYDVAREMNGELLTKDGYFVYFMAPPIESPLPKHVVFALDTSGSMEGRKNKQLIEAITGIVDELFASDFFSIIDFDDKTHPWKAGAGPIPVNDDNIQEAKKFLATLNAKGGTDVEGALRLALDTAKNTPDDVASMIVILTDGESFGQKEVLERVNAENRELKIPIFSLAFGDDADFDYLKRISLKNQGFARKIYAASDAVTQLRNFYREISTPLLGSVNVTYADDAVESAVSSRQKFLFQGQEFVTAGKLTDVEASVLYLTVEGKALTGCLIFEPTIIKIPDDEAPSEEASSYMERLFAFLSIKHLLRQRSVTDDNGKRETLESQATKLALKYGFVTELTSLVVVKPEKEELGTIEDSKQMKEIEQANQPSRSLPIITSHSTRKFFAPPSPPSSHFGFAPPGLAGPPAPLSSSFGFGPPAGLPGPPSSHFGLLSPGLQDHFSPASRMRNDLGFVRKSVSIGHKDSAWTTRLPMPPPPQATQTLSPEVMAVMQVTAFERDTAIEGLRRLLDRANGGIPFLMFVEANDLWHLISDARLQDLSTYDPATDASHLGQDVCPLQTQTCQHVLRPCDSVTADQFSQNFLTRSTPSPLHCGPPTGLFMCCDH